MAQRSRCATRPPASRSVPSPRHWRTITFKLLLQVTVEETATRDEIISIETDLQAGRLLLHWGVEGGKDYKGGWRLPGAAARPDGTTQYKERALQSPFRLARQVRTTFQMQRPAFRSPRPLHSSRSPTPHVQAVGGLWGVGVRGCVAEFKPQRPGALAVAATAAHPPGPRARPALSPPLCIRHRTLCQQAGQQRRVAHCAAPGWRRVLGLPQLRAEGALRSFSTRPRSSQQPARCDPSKSVQQGALRQPGRGLPLACQGQHSGRACFFGAQAAHRHTRAACVRAFHPPGRRQQHLV
jgi:hypothetical protein